MRSALAGLVLLGLAATTAHAAGVNRWEKFPEPAGNWESVRPPKQKGCVRVNDIDMYYAVYGEGEPVLLVHGGLANAGVWEAQVAALATRYRVIVADSRGHGRSTRVVRRALHYRDMADDYVALLTRPDTGGQSHITFVVRADGSRSDVVFQTSDTSWQAYNDYGGSDFYQGAQNGRAYKISYNRPVNTRGAGDRISSSR